MHLLATGRLIVVKIHFFFPSHIDIFQVVYPAPDVIRLAPEEGDLLLSPAINVHPKDIAKPIAVSLPLVESDRKPKKKGFLKILKKEDNYKAEFEIEDINPVFKSGETSIVEVDISGFSCW